MKVAYDDTGKNELALKLISWIHAFSKYVIQDQFLV